MSIKYEKIFLSLPIIFTVECRMIMKIFLSKEHIATTHTYVYQYS